MKKFLKKNFITTIVLFLAIALVFPTLKISAKSNEEQNYEVKISYGIDGQYRAMKYIPITIDIKSLERDFKGEIEVRVASIEQGRYDAYSTEVNLIKGESYKVNIPVKITNESSKITVNLMENNKSILEKKAIISEGRVKENNFFAGILTDDPTSLGYLGDVSFDVTNRDPGKIKSVKLDKDIIGNDSLNIDGLDLIFINNYNMGNLKKEQYDSLNAWISKGGTLIIGAGANESKTINSIDKSFLDIKSSGTNEKDITLLKDKLKLIKSNLNIQNSKVRFESEKEPLIYSIDKGNGQVLISTFDLGLEPLISSKDANELWSIVLSDNFNKMYDKNMNGSGHNYSYEMKDIIKSIPINNVVSTNVLIIVLSIYAVIIGVILYIVLKKLKKRDLTWIAVPIIAIVFSIVIYLIGSKTRVNDIILNQVNMVSVDEKGNGVVNGYLGIGTKYKNDVILEKPQDITINYLNEQNYFYGGNEEPKLNKLRVKTTYKNNNSYFTFDDSSALEMKMFDIYGKNEIVSKIEASFNFDGGDLNGKVKNNLDGNINKLLLVAGKNVWDLGYIKKGEELSLEQVKLSESNGLLNYSVNLMQNYYEARWRDKESLKSEKFKNVYRYSNLLNVLSNEINTGNESKLVAITEVPIDYGINFNNTSISKFDTTVITQKIKLDFKDKEGNINFPLGFFKEDILSSGVNVHIESNNGSIFGNGEVVFQYKIDNNIQISNIGVKKDVSRHGYEGAGEYFVYNYKTDSYDNISLSQDTVLNLENIESYVNNNELRIKVLVEDSKGESRIPKITVKGREK
ncbi:hypothetical protein JCM1393_22920 [Clostridium carnis]